MLRTTTTRPRVITRQDFAAKMRPRELEVFDLAAHEAAHAIRGALLGGEVITAGVFGRAHDTHLKGHARFREAFDRHHVAPVARSGPWAQARWLAGDRPTSGQVDAILADGGSCDREQILRALVASAGCAVDHAAETHLLERCWPSVLSLASRIYSNVQVDHDHVLESLGLTRANSSFGLANIKAGAAPRLRGTMPFTRF